MVNSFVLQVCLSHNYYAERNEIYPKIFEKKRRNERKKSKNHNLGHQKLERPKASPPAPTLQNKMTKYLKVVKF